MNVFKQFYKSIYSPKDIATFGFKGLEKRSYMYFYSTFFPSAFRIFYLSTTIIPESILQKSLMMIYLRSPIKNGQLTAKTAVPVTDQQRSFYSHS